MERPPDKGRAYPAGMTAWLQLQHEDSVDAGGRRREQGTDSEVQETRRGRKRENGAPTTRNGFNLT